MTPREARLSIDKYKNFKKKAKFCKKAGLSNFEFFSLKAKIIGPSILEPIRPYLFTARIW